jgi:predicted TIM-barrel fold metal-dependent hydrolase
MKIIVTFPNFAKDVKKKLESKIVFSSDIRFWGKREQLAEGRKTENKRAETKEWFVYTGKGTLK